MATERVEDQVGEETKVLRASSELTWVSDRQLLENVWGTMLNWNEGFRAFGAALSRIEAKLDELEVDHLAELSTEELKAELCRRYERGEE